MSKWIEIDTPLVKTISVGHLSAKAIWRLLMRQPSIDLVTCIACKYSELVYTDSYGAKVRYCKAYEVPRMVTESDYCSRGRSSE